MAEERQACCKECGKPYSYSASWAETLAAEGRSPTEYCPRCRKIHSMERTTVAVPYLCLARLGRAGLIRSFLRVAWAD